MIQIWDSEQAGNLLKEDLADLLDSHLRILPQQERFSGAIFWFKQEIEIRTGSQSENFEKKFRGMTEFTGINQKLKFFLSLSVLLYLYILLKEHNG